MIFYFSVTFLSLELDFKKCVYFTAVEINLAAHYRQFPGCQTEGVIMKSCGLSSVAAQFTDCLSLFLPGLLSQSLMAEKDLVSRLHFR